jgi:AcrR family transcriptional regulator
MKMNKMKDKAKEFIIDEACKMFLKDSIAGVTMSDIAKEVGVGDATMYRYFGSKQKIIMGVAVKLAKEVYEKYSKNDEEKTGFERIKDFYYTYLDVFKTNNSYFSFIRFSLSFFYWNIKSSFMLEISYVYFYI